jgi:hypothetical protein
LISVFDADVSPGTWVITLPAEPLCATTQQADSFYGMTIEQHLKGLPNGCIMLPVGSEVRAVKQQDRGWVCVASRGQADTDCRWGRSTGLETKDGWAQDKRNPVSSTAINKRRQGEASCGKVVAVLDHESGVVRWEPFDQLAPTYSHHFDIPGTPDISVRCGADISTDMTISINAADLSPQFLSFFGRLAQDVTGVDATGAKQAAKECFTAARWHDTFEGKPIDTKKLHVDCRVRSDFISLGVYKPPF